MAVCAEGSALSLCCFLHSELLSYERNNIWFPFQNIFKYGWQYFQNHLAWQIDSQHSLWFEKNRKDKKQCRNDYVIT